MWGQRTGWFRSGGWGQRLLWGLVSSRDFYPVTLLQGSTWTIRYNKTKTQLALCGARNKSRYYMILAHSTISQLLGGGLPPPPLPLTTHRSAPALTPFKEQARPPTENELGNPTTCFLPWCPSKALPEFLVWPLISFYWLKSPREKLEQNGASAVVGEESGQAAL